MQKVSDPILVRSRSRSGFRTIVVDPNDQAKKSGSDPIRILMHNTG